MTMRERRHKYRVVCRKCGKTRAVLGDMIYKWCQLRGKEWKDYFSEAVCLTCAVSKYNSRFAWNDEYPITCSRCEQLFQKTGRLLRTWLYRHKDVNEADIWGKYICPKCSNAIMVEQKPKVPKTYDISCPECNQTRTVQAKTVRAWARYHTPNTVEQYGLKNACGNCKRQSIVKGRGVNHGGYVTMRIYPDDPYYSMGDRRSKVGRMCLEHRYLMAQALGRPLTMSETVHHRDGNRANNDLSNLELRRGQHGPGANLHPTQEELLERITMLFKKNTLLSDKLRELEYQAVLV